MTVDVDPDRDYNKRTSINYIVIVFHQKHYFSVGTNMLYILTIYLYMIKREISFREISFRERSASRRPHNI